VDRKQHGIKGTEAICDVGGVYRACGIPDLAMHHCEGVVSQRVTGTQMDGLTKRANGALVLSPKPKGSAHRPMRRRVAWIGFQSLSGSLKG
jgi:hypothetical protein